jgi:hypothetical protein
MSVDRSHVGHQTRYELRDEKGLTCVLTYTADPDEPATWKILLPGPGGTEDLYGTERFADPDAALLQAWLSPIIGGDHAAELVAAVDAAPPPPAAWRPRGEGG